MLLGCYTNDVDSPGNDIYSLSGVSSVGACQQHCNLKDNCQYFMYGSAVSLGTCWLKYGRVTTLTPYNGLIFGPKLCGTRILLQNMYANYILTKCNICTNILCSLLIIAIESETVFANNKRCSGELFRLKPWFAHTKAICMQHCNDNAECNFYAYWSGGAGHGDCRGWTTCPSLENLSSAYKNTVYRVDRTTSGAIIINKFFNKRFRQCPQYIH